MQAHPFPATSRMQPKSEVACHDMFPVAPAAGTGAGAVPGALAAGGGGGGDDGGGGLRPASGLMGT